MQVDNEFQFLRDNNTGTLIDWHTFGKVFESFVLGGDETCCKDLDGNVHVIGKKYKIKVPWITPFFSYSYCITNNWRLVINPLCSLLYTQKLWTTKGFPFQFTGLAVPEEKQDQHIFFLLERNEIFSTLMTTWEGIEVQMDLRLPWLTMATWN